MQRFKFKSHNSTQVVSTRQKSPSPVLSSASSDTIDFTQVSTTAHDRLFGELVHIMSLSTNLRYNFIYAYGGYLLRVPQHLGINEALDASTGAVISAYGDFCRGSPNVTSRTLSLYTRALKALRLCLDDGVKACAPETLCAVMLLMICQVSKTLGLAIPLLTLSELHWNSRTSLDHTLRRHCADTESQG